LVYLKKIQVKVAETNEPKTGQGVYSSPPLIRPLSRKAIHLIRNYNRKMFERTQWRNDKISSTTNHYIFFIDRTKINN
jgi:hypothetical protein